jgi:hypothetical protein
MLHTLKNLTTHVIRFLFPVLYVLCLFCQQRDVQVLYTSKKAIMATVERLQKKSGIGLTNTPALAPESSLLGFNSQFSQFFMSVNTFAKG